MFSKTETTVFDEHRLELSVVYTCRASISEVTAVSIGTYGPECPQCCSLGPPGPAFISWVGPWEWGYNDNLSVCSPEITCETLWCIASYRLPVIATVYLHVDVIIRDCKLHCTHTNNMTTFHLNTITEDIQNWIQRFNKFNQSKVKYITSPSLRSTHWLWGSLVPRPWKAEKGSGVLSDISCHMGRGLQWKNVIMTFNIRDSRVFWWLRLLHSMVHKSLIGHNFLKNELQGKFYLPQIRFKIRSLTSCT